MQNTWDVSIQRGWIIGLILVAVLLAVTVGLVVYAVTSPINGWLFLLSVFAVITLGFAIRLVYQIWGLISASYTMDRNAVVIHWGGVEHVVPMSDIRDVVPGSELQNLRMRLGIRWPGCFLGIGKTAYAISPADLETFLPALRERLEMGPTQEMEELSTHPPFLDWEIWQDRWALGVLLGSVALLIALVGLLCWRYPYLPPEIGLRFTAEGVPMLVTGKIRIFYLALLGLIFTCVNGILGFVFYKRERTASYFLWSSLLAIIVALWAAVILLLANI